MKSKLENVNTFDLASAIAIGCRTMSSVFNADDGDIPFFGSQVVPEARLSFSTAHSEAHVPGRHLNALLNAEDALGVEIEEGVIEKHARVALYSYGGSLCVPLNRKAIDGPLLNFYPHNIREGFHALYALVAFRGDKKAAQCAEKSIETILQYWDFNGS